jgi:hypothetical protein
MALLTGFDRLDSANNTFSDWLNKTNEIVDLVRDDIMTANSTVANTIGDARLLGTFIANTYYVVDELAGGNLHANGDPDTANLVITTNTTFSNTCSEVLIANDLRVQGTIYYELSATNFTDVIPTSNDCSSSLGNTENRWEAFLCDTDINGNLNVSGNTTLNNLEVTGNTNLSSLNFSGDFEVNNLTVTGTANIASLEVSGLTANGVAFIGNESSVTTSTPQVIDTFAKSQSKGFKYIIHGVNNDATSVFTLELMCGHNDTEMFFTRYGELSNQFNVTLVPEIQGPVVQLLATCPSASLANTHTFNILRIETR